jgi:hypothetical protein
MKEGHPMTTNQAAAIRMNWKEHSDQSPCKHLNLELEWDDLGHATGNYICILCGESAAQGHLAA